MPCTPRWPAGNANEGAPDDQPTHPETDRILGSLRSADGKGVVRMEDRFETDVDDLWSALTDPGRLARWLGEVDGDLRLGGEFRARFFASGMGGHRSSGGLRAPAAPARPDDGDGRATRSTPSRPR